MNSLLFYHVCARCDAKFYTPHPIEACPRCQTLSNSTEQRIPPWQTAQPAIARVYHQQLRDLPCDGG